MKAAVLSTPQKLEIQEIPIPKLEFGQVLIKVRKCGICGSDLRYFKGENPWSLHTLGIRRDNPPNTVLGHEFSGEVVEANDRSSNYLLGKKVAVLAYRACGTCQQCRKGRSNLCVNTKHFGHGAGWGEMDYYPGGMAEYCAVWAENCYQIPETVSFEEAALLDIVGVAIHAVKVSQLEMGDTVVILGSGPVGCLIAQIARIRGAKTIFCVDKADKPLEVARAIGADAVVNTEKEDFSQFLLDNTDNKTVDVIYDSTGSPQVLKKGLSVLAPQGRLVLLAIKDEVFPLPILDIAREKTIKSSANSDATDFQISLELLARGKIKLKPFITHRFDLSSTLEAFSLLLKEGGKKEGFKVMINCCCFGEAKDKG